MYSILEVAREATPQAVRASYQRLALQHHPDKGCTDGGERFVRITAAWRVLGDEQARAEYDKKFARDSAARSRCFSERVCVSNFERCEEETVYFRRQCRCGDYYELLNEEREGLVRGEAVDVQLQCAGCSLYVTVTPFVE